MLVMNSATCAKIATSIPGRNVGPAIPRSEFSGVAISMPECMPTRSIAEMIKPSLSTVTGKNSKWPP